MLRMTRYGKTRFWALWDGQDLVAVVVYKKGAAELLRRLAAQPPAATEAAAQAAAVEAAARQAQELAEHARALAQQAQAAAQAARARAQPAARRERLAADAASPARPGGRATAPGWPPRPPGAPPPPGRPLAAGFGARSHAAEARDRRQPPHPATGERTASRACLGPACRDHFLVPDGRLPARDGRRAGVWGEGPHDPQQIPTLWWHGRAGAFPAPGGGWGRQGAAPV